MLIAWDTETALIEQGLAAPPITCLSWATEEGSGLYHWREGIEEWQKWVEEGHTFVGHHLAFDHAVLCAERPELLPVVFKLYEEGRVTDTMLRQKLLDLGEGNLGGFFTDDGHYVRLNYSLGDLYRRLLKRELDKSSDSWRLRYGELRDVPLHEWPQSAIDYAVEDARATFDVYLAQERRNQERSGGLWLVDERFQARSAWWLHLMSCWGVRTDPAKVEQLHKDTEKFIAELSETLMSPEFGFVRKDGSRDLKKVTQYMIKVMDGVENCRRTKPSKKFPEGQVSLGKEACKESGDLILEAYTEVTQQKGVLAKDVPLLSRGMHLPLHPRINSLLETGRTSMLGDNLLNLRRAPGIRECIVPRPGFVYADADVPGLELRSMAQVWLKVVGFSELANVLNEGKDPHLDLAAYILGISYEEALERLDEDEIQEKRQLSKAINFGIPGGLGPETMCNYAWVGYKVRITPAEAKALKFDVWGRKFPEGLRYLDMVGKSIGDDGRTSVTHLFSNRVRGGCSFCAAANSPFQGLGADVTKHIGFAVSKACYVDKESPLYGSRIEVFVHDQFIVSVPEARGHEAAMELARLMEVESRPWMPDVPIINVKPVLSRYWSKKAKQVWKDGRLVPWPA